jgi:hypothetical protein
MVRNVLLCGLAMALLATSATAQNIVQNGSFSTGDFTNWTTHTCPGPTCGFGSWSVGAAPTDPGTAPPSGSKAANTGCNTAACNDPANGATISQTLATVPGQTYTLSFYYDGGQNSAAGPTELEVLWNGTAVTGGTIVNAPTSTWSQRTFTVVATSASTVLEFTGEQAPAVLYLTGISVTANVTSVPALSVWGLAILGLLLMGSTALMLKRAGGASGR